MNTKKWNNNKNKYKTKNQELKKLNNNFQRLKKRKNH